MISRHLYFVLVVVLLLGSGQTQAGIIWGGGAPTPGWTEAPNAIYDDSELSAGAVPVSGVIPPAVTEWGAAPGGFALTEYKIVYTSVAADKDKDIKIKFTIEAPFTVAPLGGGYNTSAHTSGTLSLTGGTVLQVSQITDLVIIPAGGGAHEQVAGSVALVVAENDEGDPNQPQPEWDTPGPHDWADTSSGLQDPIPLVPGVSYALRQRGEFWFEPSSAGQVFEFRFADSNISTVVPEPTTLALLTVGGLMMIRRRR